MSLNKIALSACLITLAACSKQNTPAHTADNTTHHTTSDATHSATNDGTVHHTTNDATRNATNDATRSTTNDTTGMTPAAAPRSATESIARSRCQRELRCNNVGKDHKYSSDQDCLTRIRNEWKDDLSARECKSGINQTELNECLAKIRDEDCNSPLDSLARVAECTQAQICND